MLLTIFSLLFISYLPVGILFLKSHGFFLSNKKNKVAFKSNAVAGQQQLNSPMPYAKELWKGFDPCSHLCRDTEHPNTRSEKEEGLGKREDQWTEVVSWEPRVFLFHNFLSKEECEYLIKLATPHMTRSQVVNSITGKGLYVSWRTSTGASLKRGGDKIIRDIEKRIADFTFIPSMVNICMFSTMQLGRRLILYDTLSHLALKNGGQMIATVLMYLSDVEEGGETVFPKAKGDISWIPWWNESSEPGKSGTSVKPKMGDAVLFWNMKPDGTVDLSSLHGGCPVIKGNKWSCTKWLHVGEYKA